jgi:CysZ protein
MGDVIQALGRALASLARPKMLALSLWPMVLALLFWGGLAAFFWSDWVAYATAALTETPVEDWLTRWEMQWLAGYLAVALILLILFPLALTTALVIAAVFMMPVVVGFVAGRHYPALERRKGGTFLGSLGNALMSVAVFIVLWLLTLPFYLFGPLAVVVPVALSAYLNQRLFRYDALAEHASPEEMTAVIERSSGRLYLLGGVVGLTHFVPLLNLFAPIYTGLAFAHFCLEELARIRRQRGER